MATSSKQDLSTGKQPKIALVYDRAAAQGGAERVLIALRQAFSNAPLYTSLLQTKEAPWTAGWIIRTSWLQRLPKWVRRYRWWGWVMPLVFESFDLSRFDIVISVTGESAKAVITQPHQLHICYLLTPTRYLWSHRDQTVSNLPLIFRPLARKVLVFLARWDKVISSRPDIIIPISELVAQRSEEFYGRKTLAPVYPPLTVFPPAQAPQAGKTPTQPFFVTWGRHVAYKRFELVIQAAVNQRVRLIVIGQGPETAKLRRLAQKLDKNQQYISFVGRVSDAELHWYALQAVGAIFPQLEDFGIAAGEAVMAGCPVLVHKSSGITEILSSDQCVTLNEETVAEVQVGLKKLQAKKWSHLDMKHQARQYAGERFIAKWSQLVQKLWQQHKTSLQ
jgi:glycosyltransferase involved in cell wall biosynthesis